MEKPIADVYLAKWHANFFYLSKSPLKKFFACEIAITNYYDMSNYYDVRIKENNLRRLRELCPDKQRLTIYKGDICDEEFMLQLFEKERPQWVCHMAARAGVRPSIQDPYVYIHR